MDLLYREVECAMDTVVRYESNPIKNYLRITSLPMYG
jgi:hypothetical protein